MMRRVLIAVWALLAVGAAAGVIWFYVAGNVGDPTEVTAPPITATVAEPTEDSADPPATASAPTSTLTSAEDSPTPASTTPEATNPASEDPGLATTTTRSAESITDSIVELELSEGTQARFLIFEELRGEPFTVVGATSEVVGRVRVDRSDPAASQVGEILINARTFTTESSNRDRAIRGPILAAEQHEFITFRPSALVGLSAAAGSDGEWRFQMEGDLTVREVTRPVTFEVVARWMTDDVLEGEAVTQVLRSDFDLAVPSVPFVANVADEIGLELDFVARAIDSDGA